MIIIKMGGLTLVCIVSAIVMDIPQKDKSAVKEVMKTLLKRQSRLNEEEMMTYDFKKAQKQLDYQYEGWVTMDNLLEDSDVKG